MTETEQAPQTPEPPHCPRDGAPLETQTYEANIEVDACDRCHGVWLDAGELEAIQRTVERDYSRELEERTGTELPSTAERSQAEQQGPIDCPKCGKPMESREYGYSSQIIIDACVDGCGVWLDAGELRALEVFFERHREAAKLPVTWRIWATLLGVLRPKGKV